MIAAVMDCSALVALLVDGGAEAVQQNAELADCLLIAPHLVDPEFLSAMRRLARLHPDYENACERVILDYYRLQIMRVEHEPLWPEAWRWRDNLSAYDAMYVALARLMELPLVTADDRLASAAEPWCEVRRLSELQPA
ncbi:type II toxin-antitoxin system VapC family toxin [Leifsonia sp. SIMBA_070]|uniref:type II toxin-antitoxin system VapC family toxin n=1 Tax=Leifsonia sp. SIMBA_070 TaxID=3085810 RepID=UPI00397A23B0